MGLIKGNVLAKQAVLFYTGPDRTQILTGMCGVNSRPMCTTHDRVMCTTHDRVMCTT